MDANAFPLKYQCRTTGKIISARKLADQNYSIWIDETSKPLKLSVYSMRKSYKFLEDEKPRSNLKIKGD